jgi:hypothetical protein
MARTEHCGCHWDPEQDIYTRQVREGLFSFTTVILIYVS